MRHTKLLWAILLIALFLFSGAVQAATSQAPTKKQRPNILFIMSDDHAAHALSCYDSKINETPNLDRLATEGMRFANCFCTNSLCGPSRAVILTGKYSHLNGFLDNRRESRFDGSQQTVAKLLQKAGYQTAMIGKWHLKTEPTGFDYWNVLPGQGAYYDPAMIEMGKRHKHKGYTTDIIADYTLDFLKNKRDKDKPFFVMCHHKAPHRNWQPGPKYKTLYDDREIPKPETFDDDKTGYAGRGTAARSQKMSMKDLTEPGQRHPKSVGDLKQHVPKGLTAEEERNWRYQRYIKDYLRCIASVDENVGRVLDYLDESGLADNTVVFYTSDQGFFLGDHNWFDKRFMYEQSLRMPLLVRWPKHIKPGSVNNDIVLNLDFAETFLAIAGQPIPKDMQGRSLLPLLEGHTPADWRTSMYYRYYEMPGAHSVHKQYGIRTLRYKLIYFPDLKEWEMFDLKTDPNELKSVYDDPAYAKIRDDLKVQLKQLKERYGDDDSKTGPVWPPKKKRRNKTTKR